MFTHITGHCNSKKNCGFSALLNSAAVWNIVSIFWHWFWWHGRTQSHLSGPWLSVPGPTLSHISVSGTLKWALILTTACNFTVSIPHPNKPACKKYLALYLNTYEHRPKTGNEMESIGKGLSLHVFTCVRVHWTVQKGRIWNIWKKHFYACDSFTIRYHGIKLNIILIYW